MGISVSYRSPMNSVAAVFTVFFVKSRVPLFSLRVAGLSRVNQSSTSGYTKEPRPQKIEAGFVSMFDKKEQFSAVTATEFCSFVLSFA